jgi:hydroxyethylthiazole kinase-like uncharacterized protein yjeF
MKILTAPQIREADAYTIQHEPILSIDLMERAAQKIVIWLETYLSKHSYKTIQIFCGMGNNGGDGLVVTRLLFLKGYKVVGYIVKHRQSFSADCAVNLQRLQELGIPFQWIEATHDFPTIEPEDICVDALVGSGLSQPLDGLLAAFVQYLNQQPALKIAIDVPSGLFTEANPYPTHTVFCADYTLTFEVAKLSFLYDAHANIVGEVVILPIGLHPDYLAIIPTNYYTLTFDEIKNILKKRLKTAHKGTFGHALLAVGSHGKIGAAVLAAKACLRTGVGLVTVYTPACGYEILQTAVPEAMVLTDAHEKIITKLPTSKTWQAVGLGCGWGTDQQTATALYDFLQQAKHPLVIDADALNILAKNPDWLPLVPQNSIFTPHPKEFARLFGEFASPYLHHQAQVKISQDYQLYIVYKGHHSIITTPDGLSFFNTTGNAGMATAGSGDVLTGIFTSLLAQGYTPHDCCLLGVYLHGLAGDIAAKNSSEPALIARDIVANLGEAYKEILKNSVTF